MQIIIFILQILMLHFIIKILENFLNYLKNVQEENISSLENNVKKKSMWILTTIFYAILTFLPIVWIGAFLIFLQWENNYWWPYLGVYILFWLFVFKIVKILHKNFNQKYFFLIYFPAIISFASILISGVLISLEEMRLSDMIFSLAFMGIFPLLMCLKNIFPKLWEKKYYSQAVNFFLYYNIFLFFLVGITTTLSILWIEFLFLKWISAGIYLVLDTNIWGYNLGFWEYLWQIFLTFFSHALVLFFPVKMLHTYFSYSENSKKWFLFWISNFVILTILVSIIIWIPGYKNDLVSQYLADVRTHVQVNGYNEESLNEINYFIFEKAILSEIKNGRLPNINKELFTKIFDQTPEKYFGEKISKYVSNSSSFATNETKTWEQAEVIFTLGEVENNFDTNENFVKTTYEFYFENQSLENQEVIVQFQSPGESTVVSELYLWLQDELIGQIAPRWAAKKVYSDSLRKNIDPALIEKIWYNTYNLRIFPILAKNVNQGKQKVKIVMLTPVESQNFNYSPKLSLTNVKIWKKSRFSSKIYVDNTLQQEKILEEKSQIESFISLQNTINISDIWGEKIENNSICIDQDLQKYLNEENISLESEKNIDKKIHIFFDNSQSVKNNWANKMYAKIYDSIKNYDNSLQDTQLYSFNFEVEKHLKIDDISFWWYSNIDKLLQFIEETKLQNTNIVFVTDDDNFNYSTQQNEYFSSEFGKTNKFSILKIWNNIKKYKSEIQTYLSVSQGNIYEIKSQNQIENTVKNIFEINTSNIYKTCKETQENISDNWKKIQAGYISKRLLLWDNFPQESQTQVAEEYKIVNQFNSYIALETQQQQNDLDRYSNQADKYNTTFNDNESSFSNDRGNIEIRADIFAESRDSWASATFWLDNVNVNWESSGAHIFWASMKRYSNSDYKDKININFLGFILICMYLVQIFSMIVFITKLLSRKK